jgi:putrescine aminotransferase
MTTEQAPSALWHPFADMSKMQGREVVIERGEGSWVFDIEGNRYLDACAALWYCNVGHGRRELAQVAARQMEKLAGFTTFDVMASPPAIELAERVRELAPLGPDSAVFFTSGGSDSVDTAAKIARRYWVNAGEPQRQVIISREGAYHGVNTFGTSLAGIELNSSGWGPLVTQVVQVGRDDLGALERALEANKGQVAAFIGEPVQGAGGVHPPTAGYWEGVQDLCRADDVLVIADEVITGFGRLGTWFGCERYGIEPDMITCAKGLSSGYLPIGAVIAGGRVRDVLFSPTAGAFRHGYTYSGHTAACAVALANLDLIAEERLVERVAEMEPVLAASLGELAGHPLVEEVRFAGLLSGIELAVSAREKDPTVVERMVVAIRERGVIVRNLLGSALQVSPPFVIETEQIELLTAAVGDALDAEAAR